MVYQDNKYCWLFYVYSLLMEVDIEFCKRFSSNLMDSFHQI